mmetsp:Transcript_22537/g.32936  ORF Transcript_22537/g.32936 Transcript_22537/m.32936 type:complete len:287 (+) Transcript_22537:51-911(+)|eukprot:CAMPEP_0185018138 /NCGR_PEP_ID=MMETSP1103-20130426/961_1 /TAXON_ID=36769 /ORGANISM="Paraphysomonas bandaiensis, Strain Caron Lab Isolate" /LENGTH=286 /DNA_ID=CAMNT_0027547855 /DNA_START=49 /DNA_END=909 /DNA_ORIENTATION=-
MSTEEAVTSAPSSSPAGRPKRERKQAVIVNVNNTAPKQAAVPPSGSGEELGSIPYFCGMISKYTEDDDVIRALHQLLIGSVGKKGQRKRLLRQFKGFGTSTTPVHIEAKLVENKKKWTVAILKTVAEVFGLEKTGTRSELCKRIAEYVMSPYETKKESALPASKKGTKKRKLKGKRSRKDASGEPKKKRALSAFMVFSSEVRADVRAKHPEDSFGDTGRRIGEMWRELSESEKQSWKDKAAALHTDEAEDGMESGGDDGEQSDDEDEEQDADQRDIEAEFDAAMEG